MADGPSTSLEQRATSDIASEVGNSLEGIFNVLAQMPNKTDLQTWGSDLKHTIYAETATLKQEITSVRDTLEELEEHITHITADTLANSKTIQKHDPAILDLRRHTEDLENRSWRCNIRICEVPETVPNEELKDFAIKLVFYKWGFPFALLAHKGGKTFALRYPMETSHFCQQLDIPVPDISEWRNYILGPPEYLQLKQQRYQLRQCLPIQTMEEAT
ncbi:hypothetical protein XELAEV_18014842mg [Xenopus laevis]|uniref:Uncharacterized protein n=1 Tax=Xenopus laevis TaxID=8355 RepID=A0A974HVD7_XENLA|nr:hypothetical protein XELAEV_18014842mg [Xenopus laevis]